MAASENRLDQQNPGDAPVGDSTSGAVPLGYLSLKDGVWEEAPSGEVIEEVEFCLYVNGHELATIAATPVQLDALALGFLANEGLIESIDEVKEIALRGQGYCMDIWLNHSFQMPERIIRTSGCTGGVTFDQLVKKNTPLESDVRLATGDVAEAVRQLYQEGQLYQRTRGVHTSLLWKDDRVLASAEDVGRHNTLDKLRGLCLLGGLESSGSLLVSTGRISSEMLGKGRRMNCPVIASRTSATSLSVELARAWNVTLVGYVRSQPGPTGSRMLVYSHPQRLTISGGSA